MKNSDVISYSLGYSQRIK